MSYARDPNFREGSRMVSYGGRKTHVLTTVDGNLETPCGLVPSVAIGDAFFLEGDVTCKRCIKSTEPAARKEGESDE